MPVPLRTSLATTLGLLLAGGSPASHVVAGGPACPASTNVLMNEGRNIFTGIGNCLACHGLDGRGTPLGPDLTDRKWLDIDGSYAAIVKVVNAGVAKPKKFTAAMPPKGAGNLTDAQVCAVSAYVYSLSHAK